MEKTKLVTCYYDCRRCGYEWESNQEEEQDDMCPNCDHMQHPWAMTDSKTQQTTMTDYEKYPSGFSLDINPEDTIECITLLPTEENKQFQKIIGETIGATYFDMKPSQEHMYSIAELGDKLETGNILHRNYSILKAFYEEFQERYGDTTIYFRFHF